MRPSRLAANIVVLTLWAAPAAAQAPPPLRDEILKATQLNADQLKQLNEYASYWTDRMRAQTDTASVEAGRDELIKPLQSGRTDPPSPTFRFAYSKAVIDGLKPIINGKNSHAAINALRVVGSLGTDQALNLALNRADKTSEPRHEVRVWAAKAFVSALRTGNLQPNSINSDARLLKRAAEMEDNWLALRNQLAALAQVDLLVADDPNIQPTLEGRIDILTKTVDRMSKLPGPSNLIDAVYPAIFNLRNEYISLPADRQRAASAPLGLMLGRFLELAMIHREPARADAEASRSYSGAITDAEELLRLIDKQLRTAADAARCAPDAAAKWKDGDQAAFKAVVDCWTSVLSKPPYKQAP